VPALFRDVRVHLLALASLGLLVRLRAITAWSTDLVLAGDQEFYHRQGIDLARWMGFTYRHPSGELITTAVHPPLHSSWLGVVSAVGLDSPDAHRVAGAVLGAATVLTLGLAGLRLAGPMAALVAAGLVAVAPTLWINDALVQSESMYAFAVALVLLATGEFLARPDRWRSLALGAAIGLAALARAEALALVVLALVPLVLLCRDPGTGARVDRADRLRLGALGLVGVALVAGPWFVRNLTAFDRPALASTGTGFVLEIANCDRTYTGDRLGYWAPECDRTPWQAGDETATEVAKRATAVDYISANRDRLPVVVAARVGRMWDVWRIDESVFFNDFYEQRGRASSLWAMRVWWLLLALAVPGAWALRRRGATLIVPLALASATTLAAASSFGITRYRTGLEVAVALVAGVGIAAWAQAVADRRRPADVVDADLGVTAE